MSERDKVRYSITLLDINTMEILGTAAGIAANIEAVKDVAAKMSIRLPARR